MGIFSKFINSKDVTNQIARDSHLLKVMDDQTVKRMQQTLLEMYKDIKPVCDKYDIKVFLIGGSA